MRSSLTNQLLVLALGTALGIAPFNGGYKARAQSPSNIKAPQSLGGAGSDGAVKDERTFVQRIRDLIYAHRYDLEKQRVERLKIEQELKTKIFETMLDVTNDKRKTPSKSPDGSDSYVAPPPAPVEAPAPPLNSSAPMQSMSVGRSLDLDRLITYVVRCQSSGAPLTPMQEEVSAAACALVEHYQSTLGIDDLSAELSKLHALDRSIAAAEGELKLFEALLQDLGAME